MTLTITESSPGAAKLEFIEISVRTDSKYEQNVQKQLLSYLSLKNVKICEDQTPMLTRLKLESFFKTGTSYP